MPRAAGPAVSWCGMRRLTQRKQLSLVRWSLLVPAWSWLGRAATNTALSPPLSRPGLMRFHQVSTTCLPATHTHKHVYMRQGLLHSTWRLEIWRTKAAVTFQFIYLRIYLNIQQARAFAAGCHWSKGCPEVEPLPCVGPSEGPKQQQLPRASSANVWTAV